jgi:hypothetical protein
MRTKTNLQTTKSPGVLILTQTGAYFSPVSKGRKGMIFALPLCRVFLGFLAGGKEREFVFKFGIFSL